MEWRNVVGDKADGNAMADVTPIVYVVDDDVSVGSLGGPDL